MRRRHLCALTAGARVEALRREWDPVMAAVVPPHVTVTYPEETPDEDALLRRMAEIAPAAGPFRLRLGGVFGLDDGRGGVFLGVEDLDGGWERLRQGLLTTPVSFPPHLTIAHPRTSDRGPECLAGLVGSPGGEVFEIREILFTETTAATWRVLRRFPLGVPGSPDAR